MILDATNIMVLHPKVFVVHLASVKKEFGEDQASTTKKKPERDLILQSDSEQTSYETSVSMPIALPTKKKLRTIKVKSPKKAIFITEISVPPSPTDVVLIIQVFTPSKPQPENLV